MIGDNITAEIEIRFLNAKNKTFLVQLVFPDALAYKDFWPYTAQQDWWFLVTEIQPYGSDAICKKNVTLFYVHEGIYGLNMTILRAELDKEWEFCYRDLIQIKSFAFLEEKHNTNFLRALNIQLLGLSYIAVASVFVQLVALVGSLLASMIRRKSKGATGGKWAAYE